MCGRYSLTAREEDIEKRFEASFQGKKLKKRWNLAPSDELAVITGKQPETIQFFRWGLVPGWAQDPSEGPKAINARIETIHEKPTFQYAFSQQRCLVLADSYYEWKQIGKEKIPYRITMEDGGLFAMAGIWESWKGPQDQVVLSFSVITIPALQRIAHLHERMPAMLSRINEKLWLDNDVPTEELTSLLQPPHARDLTYYTVNRKVNNAHFDGPECIEPFQYTVQGSLF
jgi:putative SOS response-associated peptidase YedK